MNSKIRHQTFIFIFILLISKIYAQDSTVIDSLPDEAKVESYRIEVTYQKTTHLLFPSLIRYVDLGSDFLIAGKAEDIGNVLRLKSSVRDFEEETNFSVITEDGKFYSFEVVYNSHPNTLSYDLLNLQRMKEKENFTEVFFEDLGSGTVVQRFLENLYHYPKRIFKHISTKSYGIQFSLRSLYVDEGKIYFVIEIKNSSPMDYEIDFIQFKVADKRNLKRTIVQDKLLKPIRAYPQIDNVSHQSENRMIFLLDQVSLLDGKVLRIEMFEKNGNRHQKLQIENDDLIQARILKDLHIQMK